MVGPTARWCCGGVLSTALLVLPAPQKCSLFVTSCILLPKVCIGIVIFSHLQFLCILLPEEMLMQALQQGVPAPSLSQYST